jgi:hypothetical protein
MKPSSHQYETLSQPMLVVIKGKQIDTDTFSPHPYDGTRGMAVAKKISFGELWYLVLINEKLLWFRNNEFTELKNAE